MKAQNPGNGLKTNDRRHKVNAVLETCAPAAPSIEIKYKKRKSIIYPALLWPARFQPSSPSTRASWTSSPGCCRWPSLRGASSTKVQWIKNGTPCDNGLHNQRLLKIPPAPLSHDFAQAVQTECATRGWEKWTRRRLERVRISTTQGGRLQSWRHLNTDWGATATAACLRRSARPPPPPPTRGFRERN